MIDHAFQDGARFGVWSGGVFTPLYEFNGGRMDLPDKPGQPALPLLNQRISLDKDDVLDIDFGGAVYDGLCKFSMGFEADPCGEISFRAADGSGSTAPWVRKNLEVNAFTVENGTVLTGETGADGAVTISSTPNHLYIENRLLGGPRYATVLIWGRVYP